MFFESAWIRAQTAMDYTGKVALEVCVDTVQSAINAQKGGAARIELCSSLPQGGLTPTIGALSIVKQFVKIPVYVMIRPRAGDFCYTGEEFEMMKCDAKLLKQSGANGLVFGILNVDGTVDIDRCMELIDIARPLPVTFHRAFDVTRDYSEALETIVRLGFERILTSGGENTVLEGTPCLQRLQQQADDRITIVAGGGITEKNVGRILDESGVREFHASCRILTDSKMEYRNPSVHFSKDTASEYAQHNTCTERVAAMLRIAKECV